MLISFPARLTSIYKASVIKNAILVFAFWNGPFICYLEWLFMVHLFRTSFYSQDMSYVFHLGCLAGDRPQKKIDFESSSEVPKMLGSLKCKYEDCIFIWERLLTYPALRGCVGVHNIVSWPPVVPLNIFVIFHKMTNCLEICIGLRGLHSHNIINRMHLHA